MISYIISHIVPKIVAKLPIPWYLVAASLGKKLYGFRVKVADNKKEN